MRLEEKAPRPVQTSAVTAAADGVKTSPTSLMTFTGRIVVEPPRPDTPVLSSQPGKSSFTTSPRDAMGQSGAGRFHSPTSH